MKHSEDDMADTKFTAHTPRDNLNFSLRQELDAIDLAIREARNDILARRIVQQKEYAA